MGLVASARQGLAERQAEAKAAVREDLSIYRWRPIDYIKEKLGWTPWKGSDEEHPGQVDVLDAYVMALQQQHEKRAWESGELRDEDLRWWRPGEIIQNWIRVPAGHTVGKTKLASGIVNHFFDCFTPCTIYTTAPTEDQVEKLLWKEIKSDRRGKGLPGKINGLELKAADNHFAAGITTHDADGKGTERFQGQHNAYQLFVLDEAEGVPDFIWDAVTSMVSGGIAIVLILANPHTRTSPFHKSAELQEVRTLRISCLWHPNVLAGRELVPGAVRRDYVDSMLRKHAEIVEKHDEDAHTFDVPWRPGVIFRPDPEFCFRVLGIAPANLTNKTFVPVGRFEAAQKRKPLKEDPTIARLGCDPARDGGDFGTLYVRHAGRVWRAAQLYHQDGNEYARVIKAVALELKAQGVSKLQLRIDAGGAFHASAVDKLKVDHEFMTAFAEVRIIGVNFGGTPRNARAYANVVTELYAETAESLKGLRLENPPVLLGPDLCERQYEWTNKQGIEVRILEVKEKFRRRFHRSPDDGDGCVLAIAPDHVFGATVTASQGYTTPLGSASPVSRAMRAYGAFGNDDDE